MFRLGVCREDQYQAGSGGDWEDRIALTLLRMPVPASPLQISLFESAMLHLRLSNGVFRTTFPGRFRALDGPINDLLAGRFERAQPLHVEDWGASDCLTSTEWLSGLMARFPRVTLTASDLTMFLIEAALPDGSAFVIEAGMEPIQYIHPPFVIRLSVPEPRRLVLNRFLAWRARRRLRNLRKLWHFPENWLNSESESFEQPPFVFRKVPLVHPIARALAASSPAFSLRRHSVFEAAERPCDVIRTMNILNLSYFPRERLVEGCRAVASSLKEGGVWIVGRTSSGEADKHNVSVLIREATSFRLLERLGTGSEIEDLALRGTDFGL